ncbi:hypothetical protein COAQ111491_11370 [Comamonas aquatilis]
MALPRLLYWCAGIYFLCIALRRIDVTSILWRGKRTVENVRQTTLGNDLSSKVTMLQPGAKEMIPSILIFDEK